MTSDWQPIETRPASGEVVLFCDASGNRWTDCSYQTDLPYPECGYYPRFWMPLPPPPNEAQLNG